MEVSGKTDLKRTQETTNDEEQQQNEEQRTPERAPATSVMKISPEDAATRTWGGKVLFRK